MGNFSSLQIKISYSNDQSSDNQISFRDFFLPRHVLENGIGVALRVIEREQRTNHMGTPFVPINKF